MTPATPRLVSYRSSPKPVSHPRLYFCIYRNTAEGCFQSSRAPSGDPRGRDRRRLVADRLAVIFAIRRFACSEPLAKRANLQFRDHIRRAGAGLTVIARLRSKNLVHHGLNAHRGAPVPQDRWAPRCVSSSSHEGEEEARCTIAVLLYRHQTARPALTPQIRCRARPSWSVAAARVRRRCAGLGARRERCRALWCRTDGVSGGGRGAGVVVACPLGSRGRGGARGAACRSTRSSHRVANRGPRARLVPVRAIYTEMVREAAEETSSGKFITAEGRNAVHRTAERLTADGLLLPCARNTWLTVHLVAGTPLAVLRVLEGPMSMNTPEAMARWCRCGGGS